MRLTPLLLLLSVTLLVAGCSTERPPFTSRILAFGTLIDLTIADASPALAEQAATEIEQDFLGMHKRWHAWDPGELGRINRLLESGDTFSVPASIVPLIELGQRLSKQSDGLFNPAIGRLIASWGFHRNDPAGSRPPPAQQINRLVADNPQMDDIRIDGLQISSSNPAVRLDFGAFGKGYGIDLAIDHLRSLGIDNAIINAGGDLRAIGSRGGKPWRIAIRNPSGSGVMGIIEVQGDESVFTSGDYERNFTWKGKRYGHIIDPRSGYPAEGVTSVTVLADNSTLADAAATALFIAGPDDWQRIARQMGIHYVLLIDSDGNLRMNPAMQDRLQLLGDSESIILSPPLFSNGNG